MKFELKDPQPLPDIDYSLRVGNVYPSKNTRHTKYWVVVSLHEGTVHMLGIDAQGNVTKTASYGQHVFNGSSPLFNRGDSLLGVCQGIAEMNLEIDWI